MGLQSGTRHGVPLPSSLRLLKPLTAGCARCAGQRACVQGTLALAVFHSGPPLARGFSNTPSSHAVSTNQLRCPGSRAEPQVRFLARGFSNPGDHTGQASHGYRWPYGPVALITPFNFPLEIPVLQVG